MVSPVAGFLPSRAFLSERTSLPKPGKANSPLDLTSSLARFESSSKSSLTCARFKPNFSAKWLMTSDCVMRFLPDAAVAIAWCDYLHVNLGKIEKAYGSNIYHTTGRKSPSKSLFSAILKENLLLEAGRCRRGSDCGETGRGNGKGGG